MPIGIFLFAQKPEFQKSEENGEKRRKTRDFLGFFDWHLFCQDALSNQDGKTIIKSQADQ